MTSCMPKCAECGYLGGVREKPATKTSTSRPNYDSELLEVQQGQRELDEKGGRRPRWLACFKGRDEITPADAKGSRQTDPWRDHDCPAFTEYKAGYTPRRTQELRHQQWLEQREDQRDRENRRHKWKVALFSTAAAGVVGLIVTFVDKI